VLGNELIEINYSSKPLYLYPAIWDALNWATHEWNCKVDYNYGLFVATFKNLVLKGCTFDPIQVSVDVICSENLKAQDRLNANISCLIYIVMFDIGTLFHHRSVLLFRKRNKCLKRLES